MKIKVNCKILSEQIQFLDMASSAMSNKLNKELVDGITELLSQICFAIEEKEEVMFTREDCE